MFLVATMIESRRGLLLVVAIIRGSKCGFEPKTGSMGREGSSPWYGGGLLARPNESNAGN